MSQNMTSSKSYSFDIYYFNFFIK